MTPSAFANQAVTANDVPRAETNNGDGPRTAERVNEKGQNMGGTITQELSEDLFAKAYRSQLGIQFLIKECESKDAALRKLESEISELRLREKVLEEDKAQLQKSALTVQQFQSEAQASEERMKTLDCVLSAVIMSLRPFGLDKKKFTREIINISRGISNDDTQKSRHSLLHAAATKILKGKLNKNPLY